MITYQQGNLLEADVEALVNTVNTVGVMGKRNRAHDQGVLPGSFQGLCRCL